MKLSNKLTFKIAGQYLILFALAFLILISVISSLFSSKLNAELNMVTKQKLGLIASELNTSTNNIKNLHYNLIHDNEMQQLMHSYNNAVNDVITSYSIHYTKLYDFKLRKIAGISDFSFLALS